MVEVRAHTIFKLVRIRALIQEPTGLIAHPQPARAQIYKS